MSAPTLAQTTEQPAAAGNRTMASVWREFGQQGGHAVGSGSLPTEWSNTKNVSWKTAIPGNGWSSLIVEGDIVEGDEVWLTTSIGKAAGGRGIAPHWVICNTWLRFGFRPLNSSGKSNPLSLDSYDGTFRFFDQSTW